MNKILSLIFILSTLAFGQSSFLLFYDNNTTDVTAPLTPSGLLAVGGVTSTILTWNAVASTDLSRYLIYRKASDDSSTSTLIDSVYKGTLTKTFTGLTENAVWYWWVKAVDSTGNKSYYSNGDSAQVTPVAPAAPTSLAAIGSGGSSRVGTMTLTWVDPTDADCDSIRIYQDGVWINSVAKGVQTKVYTTLTTAVYSYTLKAKDLAGNLSVASSASADTIYEFEVVRYLNACTVSMHDSVKWKINTVVKWLKDSLTVTEATLIDSLPQIYDLIVPLSVSDSASSKLNLVKRSHDAVTIGSYTFTAFQGWKKSSGTTYMVTNYNPYTDTTGNFGRLSGGIGVYVRAGGDDGMTHGSVDATGAGTRFTVDISGNFYTRYCANASGSGANNGVTGYFVQNRLSSTTNLIYKNGALLATIASTANTAFANLVFYLGAFNNNGTSNGSTAAELSWFVIRKKLSAGGNRAENNIFEWYMDSNGKGIE